MVDFLNDDVAFDSVVTTRNELVANGGLTIGPGGMRVGQPASEAANSWPAHLRARVANVTERDALVAWRTSHTPISTLQPLAVWRADGSSTGLDEITIDGEHWYAESASAGDVELTLTDTAPYGWVLMQGQILANAQFVYPALWANVSTAFRQGADLRVPDMRGRSPMGAGQGQSALGPLTLRNMGDWTGEENVALSPQQLPSHGHNGTTGGIDRSLNHLHHFSFGHNLGAEITGNTYNYETHGGAPGLTNHATSWVAQVANPNTNGDLQHAHAFSTDGGPGQGWGHPNVHPVTIVNYKLKV